MVERVIHRDLPAAADRQAMSAREVGITGVVLSAAAARLTELHRPPALHRAKAALLLRRDHEHLLCSEQRAQLRAQPAHSGLQAAVEHVADHGHAASHPLAAAAELRMVKL